MFFINEITKNDYQSWKIIFKEYLTFYNSELTDSTIKSSWDKIINKDEQIYCLGCYKSSEKNKELIGIMNFIFHKSTWSKKHVCYLEDLFIQEDYRLKGCASLLIKNLVKICKISHIEKIYWKTKSDNYQAQSLYNKFAIQTDFLEYEILL